ncbi:MAG: hypothetical protein NVSMB6_17690 [Burkholderiaceae bacterium]
MEFDADGCGHRVRNRHGAGDCPDIGGSCRFGKDWVGIGDPVKSMPKPGAKGAVVDCATYLQ